jgi:YHS domain-containing protein
MKLRLGFSAKAWLLGTATGLILSQPVPLVAQTAVYVNQPEELRTPASAVDRGPYGLASPPRSLGAVRNQTARPIQQTAGAQPQALPPSASEQPSEVQRELERLYRSKGQQPPSMDLSELPNTDPAYLEAVRKRSAAEQAQAKPSLMQRFFPFLRRSRPAPAPQPAQPHHPVVQQPVEAVPPTAPQEQSPLLPPPNTAQAPVAPAEPRTAERRPEWTLDLPEIQPAQDSGPSVAEQPSTDPLGDDFDNPFPEVSEAQADGRENPFSGLKLGAPSTEPSVTSSDAPYLPEPEAADLPEIKPADTPLPHREPKETNVADKPATPKQGQDNSAKMRLIASRSELKGLKGFCPVVLRDRRDLIDSRSQFSSTFKSKMYYFSSAEAKAEFDRQPELYAPVEGGADIVLLMRDDLAVSGSLDYAAWFQNRLYLFSSRENLETFVHSPRTYTDAAEEEFGLNFDD